MQTKMLCRQVSNAEINLLQTISLQEIFSQADNTLLQTKLTCKQNYNAEFHMHVHKTFKVLIVLIKLVSRMIYNNFFVLECGKCEQMCMNNIFSTSSFCKKKSGLVVTASPVLAKL